MQKSRYLKIIDLWAPVLTWMVIIFTFSSMQVGSASEFYWKDFVIKKTAHIIEYGILATLIFRALIGSNVKKEKAMFFAVLFAFLYGCTDEFHQSFTPGREPRLRDVLIDTTGAIIFVFGVINNLNKLPVFLKKMYTRLNIVQ